MLHLFVFDESYGSIQSAGSVDLTGYYTEGMAITQACFVSGSEEILVIDSGNMARIYSLQPQQFRCVLSKQNSLYLRLTRNA